MSTALLLARFLTAYSPVHTISSETVLNLNLFSVCVLYLVCCTRSAVCGLHFVLTGNAMRSIVLVTDRVLGEKIALRAARSLNGNHAMFTTATVSHCLLNFESVRNAIQGCHRHPLSKIPTKEIQNAKSSSFCSFRVLVCLRDQPESKRLSEGNTQGNHALVNCRSS